MADCTLEIIGYQYNSCGIVGPGLIPNLLVTFKDWVDTVPALDDYPTTGDPNTISSDITLDTVTYPTATWARWFTSPEKASFESESSGDFGARAFSSTLSAFIPGNDALVSYLMNKTLNNELIVLYQYNNKNWRLLGDADYGAFANFKETTGAARGDSIGYEVTLEVPIHDVAFPYYTGTVPAV